MFWCIRRWGLVSSSCRGGEGSWSRSFWFDGRVYSGIGVESIVAKAGLEYQTKETISCSQQHRKGTEAVLSASIGLKDQQG